MSIRFTKLTRQAMKSLTACQKITEHGICYEKLPTGDGRFSVNIMVDGQRIHRVIGKESDGVTRTTAEEFIENTRTDARRSRLNLPEGRKLHIGFKDAATQYTTRLTEETGMDVAKKKQRLELHLKPFFKDKPLSQITSSEIDRYKQRRKSSGAANGTINRELAIISHLFTKAVDWKWIPSRPGKINRLKEDQGRIIYLTKDQVVKLLDAASKHQSPFIYLFILVALETSMRRSEILTIKIKNIAITRRIIYIPRAKAGPREQPITKNLADYLSSYLENNASEEQVWLFPSSRSKSGHISWPEQAYREVVDNAGLDPKEIVIHTLRHTAITHLVQAGIDLPTVQRISGHKTLHMVAKYSHQNGEHIQAAMDVLEKRYSNK